MCKHDKMLNDKTVYNIKENTVYGKSKRHKPAMQEK